MEWVSLILTAVADLSAIIRDALAGDVSTEEFRLRAQDRLHRLDAQLAALSGVEAAEQAELDRS